MTGSIYFMCPRCGRKSYNPNDIREGYCGHCKDWTAIRLEEAEIPEREIIHVGREAGDPCPICNPGRLYLGTDGFLSCNNCMWNSEED